MTSAGIRYQFTYDIWHIIYIYIYSSGSILIISWTFHSFMSCSNHGHSKQTMCEPWEVSQPASHIQCNVQCTIRCKMHWWWEETCVFQWIHNVQIWTLIAAWHLWVIGTLMWMVWDCFHHSIRTMFLILETMEVSDPIPSKFRLLGISKPTNKPFEALLTSWIIDYNLFSLPKSWFWFHCDIFLISDCKWLRSLLHLTELFAIHKFFSIFLLAYFPVLMIQTVSIRYDIIFFLQLEHESIQIALPQLDMSFINSSNWCVSHCFWSIHEDNIHQYIDSKLESLIRYKIVVCFCHYIFDRWLMLLYLLLNSSVEAGSFKATVIVSRQWHSQVFRYALWWYHSMQCTLHRYCIWSRCIDPNISRLSFAVESRCIPLQHYDHVSRWCIEWIYVIIRCYVKYVLCSHDSWNSHIYIYHYHIYIYIYIFIYTYIYIYLMIHTIMKHKCFMNRMLNIFL